MSERAVVPGSAPISRAIQDQTTVCYVVELPCHSSSGACQQLLLSAGGSNLILVLFPVRHCAIQTEMPKCKLTGGNFRCTILMPRPATSR